MCNIKAARQFYILLYYYEYNAYQFYHRCSYLFTHFYMIPLCLKKLSEVNGRYMFVLSVAWNNFARLYLRFQTCLEFS